MESIIIRGVILVAFFCCLTPGSLSEGRHGKQIPAALIIGTVLCDECLSHFISVIGASVVLECGDGMSSKRMFRKEAKMNERGEFQVPLPVSASKHLISVKECSVRLMSSNEPDCAVASSTISTTLVHLNSGKFKGSLHVFSTGLLSFKPLDKSSLRSQRRNLRAHTDEQVTSMKNTILKGERTQQFIPYFGPELTPSTIPQLPQLSPLPRLQPLPALPSLPTLPQHKLPTPKPVEEISQNPNVINQKSIPSTFLFPFPPNPLQPPSLLPPNPLLPPPSIFPPMPGLTPPPSGILPPIPGLTPPPAGIFPPLPGIPTLPGTPGIPGFAPPIPGLTPPPSGILPPIPGLTPPPPPASIFPPLPGIPTPPGIPGIPGFAPPIPGLTPPPSGILPPIPGLTPPPPPASIFPPLPGIPTLPGIPGFPGFAPPPPPPPPPSLLPPFPFPPGFPGIPPAASMSSAQP